MKDRMKFHLKCNLKLKRTTRLAGLILTLALLLALALSGCTVKPDSTVQDPLTDNPSTLPFDATATPAPTPTPSPTPILVTRAPTATPIVDVFPAPEVTATPTPAPTAAGNYQDWADDTGILVPSGTAQPGASDAAATPVPAPTATPFAMPTEFTTLRQGMKGEEVSDMQRALYQLGYYNGTVDGAFGAGTKNAVTAFQKANGLNADGIAGAKTLTLLYSRFAPSANTSGSTSGQTAPTVPPAVTAKPTATPKPTEKPIAGPSTYRYLDVGSTGEDVRQLQSRLKQLGYYTASISGTYDSATSYAVVAFQSDNKLWTDGKAGPETQTALYKSSVAKVSATAAAFRTLRSGVTGDDVYKLQKYLIDMGYMSGTVSGYYDARTGDAVKAFQQRNGLTADGIAGASTQQKIFSPGAVPAANVNQLFPDGSNTTEPIPIAATPPVQVAANTPQDSKSDIKSAASLPPAVTNPAETPSGAIVSVAPDSSEDIPEFQEIPQTPAPTLPPVIPIETPYVDTTITATGAINGTLKAGMSGEGVKILQEQLKELDYYLGPIDGNYSDAVTASVRRFQTRNLLASDGVAGSGTQRMLFSNDALRSQLDMTPNVGSLQYGDRSDDVIMLQDRLIRLGYITEGATGFYGSNTREAVTAFQKMNDLPDDGYAGGQTLSLLFSDYALSAAGTLGTMPPEPTAEPTPSAPATPAPTSDISLREGDSGAMVTSLKEALIRLGYMSGSASNAYDEATTAAVKRFQVMNGLDSDGIASAQTQARLFSRDAEPWPTLPSGNADLTALDNSSAEKREFQLTGTTQTNLSSGGIAALSSSGALYYADGATGGRLYTLSAATGSAPVGDDYARFIHAIGSTVVYATNNEIIRYNTSNGRRESIANVGLIKKLAVSNDYYYYLEGGILYRCRQGEDKRELTGGVNDFYLDVSNGVLYVATNEDIRRLDSAGNPMSTVIQTGAQQVLLCDGVLYFLRDGTVYRIDSGRDASVVSGSVSWFGFYRQTLYYIVGSRLIAADTNGMNAREMDMGPVASVAFINGEIYLGASSGGGYNQKLTAP